MTRLASLLPLLLFAACGGGESDSETIADERVGAGAAVAPESGADASAGTAQEQDGSGASGADGESAAADEIVEAPTGSLRDRVKTTPPPPFVEDPYYSTAVTLDERKARVRRAVEAAGAEGDVVLDMHDLGGWEFDEREKEPFPEYVRQLEGRTIVVRGFMMPDIDFEHIRTFHLVRSLWGCCFGAPPRINEILRVTLADDEGMDYTYNTLEVKGVFRAVFEMEDGMVDDVYRLENATFSERGYEDPQAPTNFDAETGFEGILPVGGAEY